ncbi:hypothetical protein K439DRAFT_1619969 [Ramaria rubella]|nr:hypothetical protein K439DRAFT_1619969 [Ramaria rubella]
MSAMNNVTSFPTVEFPLDVHSFWFPVWTLRVFQASLIVCLFSLSAVGYVEVSYRVLRHHYQNGKLKRYFPLPTNREYTSNLINAVAFISPAVFLYYFYLNPTKDPRSAWLSPARPMSFNFNPIEAIIYLVGYMFMHDTMFYYMHTHAHADKWMYKMTHALHHEYTHEMNLFTTAYAEAFENFYQTGTPWAIWTAISFHNFWLLNLPLTLNLTTTSKSPAPDRVSKANFRSAVLGHSGYKAHPSVHENALKRYFAHLNPVLYVVQKLFGAHLLSPSDHQAHHSHRRYNYGLYFRWQDKWHGTYHRANMPSYPVDYWTNLVKTGAYAAHGKSAALDGTRQKMQLQYEETAWGL